MSRLCSHTQPRCILMRPCMWPWVTAFMHELTKFGIYKADHLKIHPSVRKTLTVSRFSLARLEVIPWWIPRKR